MVNCKLLIELATNASDISAGNVTIHEGGESMVPSTIMPDGTLSKIQDDLRRRIQDCMEKPETADSSFITANERMLVAIILGAALIFLILMTLKFSLKVFSRYYEDRSEETEIDTSLQL